MDRLTAPNQLVLDGNIAENWRKWKQDFTFYMVATESEGKSDKVKSCLLLHCIGPKAREVYNTFTFADDDDKLKYEEVVNKFDAYLTPKKNITFTRFKFFTYRQSENQPFEKYHTELTLLCSDCEFGALQGDLLRDMIVIGVNDKRLQERLLSDVNLTLDKCITVCKTYELTKEQAKTIRQEQAQSSQQDHNVDYINRKPVKYRVPNEAAEVINQCKFCSFTHKRGSCPAYHKICILCQKKGHFAKCCPNKEKKINHVGYVTQPSSSYTVDSEDEDYYFIGTVAENSLGKTDNEWSVDLITNNTVVNYKIDTGAQANVLPMKIYKQLVDRPKLHPSKVKLKAYNDTKIPVLGQSILQIKHRNMTVHVLFIVADIDSPPIVGLKTSANLNLIQRVMKVKSDNHKVSSRTLPSNIAEYADCFGKIGTLPGHHRIVIDESIPPVVYPPRRVPFSMRQRLREELNNMVKMKIIAPVEEPTNWVNNLVIVEKPNGNIRVCLDPRELNKAIKRPHYSLPTTESILAEMSGAKRFTKLDASNAYWQIQIDEDSSKLLTFNTHYGRYRFLRMPYGIHSASDVCQQRIAQIINGITGTANSQDDIIVWGENEAELEVRTKQVLESVRSHGLKLNKSKCQFNQEEIVFLGHKISSSGIKPDDTKQEAITQMPYPENIKDLQRFLGMINYLGKFIPNLSEQTVTLRKLLEKGALWYFDENHKREIDNLKKLVTNSPLLKFYNPNLKTKVSCDASSTGLGAVLEQEHDGNWHPIAYASRSLNKSEQNYCQLEKEVLSIVFACNKFHDYVYGMKFEVYNDHLPLQAIFNRSIVQAPPRIQRFLLRLQRYNLEMNYIKGSLLTVADTLSRAALQNNESEIDESELSYYVHSVVTNYLISDEKLKQVQEATQNDQTSKVLTKYIQDGWPKYRKRLPKSIQPYFCHRHDLTLTDNLILKGNQIVVPELLRNNIKNLLHTAHLGIDKIRNRARGIVYWPGYNADLEEIVGSCETCQKYQNQQKTETLIKHKIPEVPWTKVGTDLFVIGPNIFLIVVDYTTNFFDISFLPNKESVTVVKHTKEMFSRMGIPKDVFSDNGPEFIAKTYETFSLEWDFNHDSSSPRFPQSNGQVERTIQTVERTLMKAYDNNEDLYLSMLALRTAPGPYNNAPPASLFYNRNIRSTLPSVNPLYQKENFKPQHQLQDQKYRKDLPELCIGDKIRIHDGKSWSVKAEVIEKLEKEPRSYLVITSKGTILRRNRKHLLFCKSSKLDTYQRETRGSNEIVDYEEAEEPQEVENDIDNNVEEGEEELDVSDEEVVEEGARVTRSGRNTRVPQRFNDYDMA